MKRSDIETTGSDSFISIDHCNLSQHLLMMYSKFMFLKY